MCFILKYFCQIVNSTLKIHLALRAHTFVADIKMAIFLAQQL